MKKVERIAVVTQRIVLLCLLGAVLVMAIGCGEEEDDTNSSVITEGAATGTLGVLKMPEVIPAAPSAPQTGFYVKEVGYYADWKLTKALTGTVEPGTKVFVKIVFSEPTRFVPADDDSARPILYYRVGNERHRYRVAEHGARGDDFVSGDTKPWGSGTDDYIGKFVIPEETTGRFRVEIGKFNANENNEFLSAFYVHGEELQIAEGEVTEETPPETVADNPKPTAQEPVTDTTPPAVLSVQHYLDDKGMLEIGENERVAAGTDIFTVVKFSEPVTPIITYTTRGEEKRFGLGLRGGVHWRGTCKPMDAENTTFVCRQYAWGDTYQVTVLADTADISGNRLGEDAVSLVVPVGSVQPTPQESPAPVQPTAPATEEIAPVTRAPAAIWKSTQDPHKYSFSFDGHTYPGFNPSPNLQRILNTHPSAKLPFFEDAVMMVEVIDWVYRKSYNLYYDTDRDKMKSVRDAVKSHFGLPENPPDRFPFHFELALRYFIPPGVFEFDFADIPPYSKYWFDVEFFRLRLQYPGESTKETAKRWGQSADMGYIVGTTNPNS